MKTSKFSAQVGPQCKQHVIGIRPGENLHGMLITRDDARHTIEFDDLYINKPTIQPWDQTRAVTYDGESARAVADNFEFSSDQNVEYRP